MSAPDGSKWPKCEAPRSEEVEEVMTLTCPDHTCGYNGFGLCQMDIPLEALRAGRVTQHNCPFYRAAHTFLREHLAIRTQPTPEAAPFPTAAYPTGSGLAQPGQWYPKTSL